jgi:hypothetical protein
MNNRGWQEAELALPGIQVLQACKLIDVVGQLSKRIVRNYQTSELRQINNGFWKSRHNIG